MTKLDVSRLDQPTRDRLAWLMDPARQDEQAALSAALAALDPAGMTWDELATCHQILELLSAQQQARADEVAAIARQLGAAISPDGARVLAVVPDHQEGTR